MTNAPAFAAKGITPTAEQLAVQTASAPTLLIEANAGAAKTTTLALRMAEGGAAKGRRAGASGAALSHHPL